jgi:hypothetical protein
MTFDDCLCEPKFVEEYSCVNHCQDDAYCRESALLTSNFPFSPWQVVSARDRLQPKTECEAQASSWRDKSSNCGGPRWTTTGVYFEDVEDQRTGDCQNTTLVDGNIRSWRYRIS